MAIITLGRNNKNQYRRYPIKQGSSLVADDGYVLSDKLLVSCSLTTTYGKHRLYVKQIFYKSGIIRVAIASFFDDSVIGVFEGDVTQDFTTLQLSPFEKFVSGNLTIGSAAELVNLGRILNFSKEVIEFEESLIFCYTPPAVKSVADKRGIALRGNVAFGNLTNITKTTAAKTTQLKALNPASIFNPSDKSSFLGNCNTPVIKNINGITPFKVGEGSTLNDGNIYVAGVKPVIFYGVPAENNSMVPGAIGVDTGEVTLDKLCTQRHKLLPPVDVTGFTLDSLNYKNMYYSKPALPDAPSGSANYPLPRPARLASNFNATTKPEYYYWPQFVKPEYYQYWAKPNQ